MRTAVFPGSFDPVTRGHESLIIRALGLFDKVIIAIGENSTKSSFYPLEKRIHWLREVFKDHPGVVVDHYSGLTIDYCKKQQASFILRGLRTSADFAYEWSIGQVNKQLQPDIETVFLLAEPQYAAIHSSLVREVIKNGGDPGLFVPEGLSLQ